MESAISNGYGQHLGVARTSNAKHYLVGNDGVTVFSSPDFGDSQQGVTAVSSFGSYVNVAYRYNVGTNHDVIRLQRSSDGGEHWLTNAFQFDPADSFSNNQNIAAIDAYSDARGVHIVWESSNEVYYVLFNPNIPDFRSPKQVTDLSPGTGFRPKVVTSANKAHVSFVRTDVEPDAVATRDASFSTNGGISWESSYENVPITQSSSNQVYHQSIARLGDTLHVVFFQYIPSGPHPMQASKRFVGGTSWSSSTSLPSYSLSEFDGRRCLTAVGDTLFLVYSPYQQGVHRIDYLTYRSGSGWSSSVAIATGASYNYGTPTISSSRTGVYVYWHHNNYSTAWMQRRVFSLSGHVTENMFFTGNNWITDDLTIDAGVTVTLKAGSTTYVADNKKLIVANGGILKKERGSQIIFGTGATFQINPRLIDSWNMTGIPVVLSDFDTSVVYPTKVSAIFAFNAGYVKMNPLTNDRGWWVKFNGPQTYQYEGEFIDYMAMNAYNGWNIIGSISVPIDSSLVYTSPAGNIGSSFYKYNAGYERTTTIEPGGGYWVKTNAQGFLILNQRTQPGLLRGVPGQSNQISGELPDPFDSYDRFTVTDAAGGQQHLYVRNATLAGTTENMEMPPPPPDNAFDVRFAPAQYLYSVLPDSVGTDLSILLGSVTYPVELSWNIHPENGLTYSMLSENGGGLGRGNPMASSRSMVIHRSDGTIRLNVSNRPQRKEELPAQFALEQNYPNPFNPSTTLQFSLPEPGNVTLVIYDVLGREVATLVNRHHDAGYHSAIWNAAQQASGVYFARLNVKGESSKLLFTRVTRLVLTK